MGEDGGKDNGNISGLGSDSQTELETAFQLTIKFLQLLILLSALLNKS